MSFERAHELKHQILSAGLSHDTQSVRSSVRFENSEWHRCDWVACELVRPPWLGIVLEESKYHTGGGCHERHQAVHRKSEEIEILLPEELVYTVGFGDCFHLLLDGFVCLS